MSIRSTLSEGTDEIYPGLTVCDGRVSGSIIAGLTRLPLWAFIGTVVEESWAEANESYEVESTGLTKRELSDFLYNLLEMRGEFGRLILLMAEAYRVGTDYWYEEPSLRERMQQQLQRCLETLQNEGQ